MVHIINPVSACQFNVCLNHVYFQLEKGTTCILQSNYRCTIKLDRFGISQDDKDGDKFDKERSILFSISNVSYDTFCPKSYDFASHMTRWTKVMRGHQLPRKTLMK